MCEKLQELLDEARASGNTALVTALEAAMIAAGCDAATTDGGGTGNGPPTPKF